MKVSDLYPAHHEEQETSCPVTAAGRSLEALKREFGDETEIFLPAKLDVTNESEVHDVIMSAVRK